MQIQLGLVDQKDRWASNDDVTEHDDELCQPSAEFAQSIGLSVDDGLQRSWIDRGVDLKAVVVKDVGDVVSNCLDYLVLLAIRPGLPLVPRVDESRTNGEVIVGPCTLVYRVAEWTHVHATAERPAQVRERREVGG